MGTAKDLVVSTVAIGVTAVGVTAIGLGVSVSAVGGAATWGTGGGVGASAVNSSWLSELSR